MAIDFSTDVVQQHYEQAKAKLLPIAVSTTANQEQKDAARQALDDLNLEFIGNAVASFEERTEQFQDFIDRMELAIDEIGSGGLLPGLQQLQAVVDQASTLLTSVQGEAD